MHKAEDVVFLQGVCSHDPRTGGAGMGEFSTRSKTRFSFRPQDGKTSFEKKYDFGQKQSSVLHLSRKVQKQIWKSTAWDISWG